MTHTALAEFFAAMTAEAWTALGIGIPTLIVSIVAIVIAIRANGRASAANRIAENSNGIATDANKIAKESVENQKLTSPPEWGAVVPVPGRKHWYGIENRSGRDINVLEFKVKPADSAGSVRFHQEPGEIVGYGDSLYLAIEKSLADDPREVEVAWVYADRNDDELEWNYLYRALIY